MVKTEKGVSRSYVLGQAEQIIGRSTKADIKIAELYISRKHAKIFFDGTNHVIEDLKSHIGTSYDGVRFDRHVLKDGDLITIGSIELVYNRVATSTKDDEHHDEDDGQATMSLGHIPSFSLLLLEQGKVSTSFDIGRQPLIIGRLDSCDIHLQSPMISRNHAKIWMEGDKAMIEDLGSNNGTYVGKAKVKKSEVVLGEDIKIGPFKLKLVDPNTFEGTDSKAGENPKLVQRMISFLKKKNQ
jgi:pSer/pThr/pTyr-binding forkhead associated (FHA) protein